MTPACISLDASKHKYCGTVGRWYSFPMAETPRWAKGVVGDRQKAPDIIEIFDDPEMAMNFAAVGEHMINAIGPAGGTLAPTDIAQQQQMASALTKIHAFAHRSHGERAVPIDLTQEERSALGPVFSQFQRGREAGGSAEKFLPESEVTVLIDWASRQPGNNELTALLAMQGSRADKFFPQALKALAYTDPDRFRQTVDALAAARNFAKSDARVLQGLRKFGDQFGLEERELLGAVEHPDWLARISAMVDARTQGRPGIRSQFRDFLAGVSVAKMRLSGSIEAYRAHGVERQRLFSEISAALTGIINTPGVVSSAFEHIAFKPNSSPESKTAYETVRTTKENLGRMIDDDALLDPAIKALSTDSQFAPDWAVRATDPAARERVARGVLEQESRSRLNSGATEGGFWSALVSFLTSLFGTTYGAGDVNKVSERIRRL